MDTVCSSSPMPFCNCDCHAAHTEVLGSLKCDCAEQLQLAMTYIQEHPNGVIIYLQQEGRGIGLSNKIAAYSLQVLPTHTLHALQGAVARPIPCFREITAALPSCPSVPCRRPAWHIMYAKLFLKHCQSAPANTAELIMNPQLQLIMINFCQYDWQAFVRLSDGIYLQALLMFMAGNRS